MLGLNAIILFLFLFILFFLKVLFDEDPEGECVQHVEELVVLEVVVGGQVQADDELVLLHFAPVEALVPPEWSSELE